MIRMSEWQVGVAFVRGLNMFKVRRAKAEKIFRALKRAENKSVRFIGMYKTDDIIFVKRREVPYAAASSIIERELSKLFKERIYVTSRSLRSIRGVIGQAQEAKTTKLQAN